MSVPWIGHASKGLAEVEASEVAEVPAVEVSPDVFLHFHKSQWPAEWEEREAAAVAVAEVWLSSLEPI